jgi:hypothetical protein
MPFLCGPISWWIYKLVLLSVHDTYASPHMLHARTPPPPYVAVHMVLTSPTPPFGNFIQVSRFTLIASAVIKMSPLPTKENVLRKCADLEKPNNVGHLKGEAPNVASNHISLRCGEVN